MEEFVTPKIKICGITDFREAEYLKEADVDYAGFVFYEKSRRNVTLELAREIGKSLAEKIKKVAVTVSPDVYLAEKLFLAGFDIIQIHGELKPQVLKEKFPLWRAVNITDDLSLEKFFSEEEKRGNTIAGFLVDGAGYGGGKAFDWEGMGSRIKKYTAGRDLILAGGLNAENVKEGIRAFSPQVVDVSSSVEDDTGKNRQKILEFVRQVRSNA